LAERIASQMIDHPTDKTDKSITNDVLGELVNVICGRATSQMSKEKDMEFSLSVPSIITGVGHQITHLSDVPCLAIVFETEHKPFAVQVAIRYD
jgi:chemotaxis protein CheX